MDKEAPRWGALYAMQWQRVGPPLRLGPDDIDAYQRAVTAWGEANGGRAARACVFGATPELANLRWTAGSRVVAVDHSIEALNQIWYWGATAQGGAVAADWLRLPLPPASIDLVLGDGIPIFFPLPAGQIRLLESIAGILAPGGRAVIRAFLRPDTPETVEEVLADLEAGRIGTFTVFKWRLLAAVHGTRDTVALRDVWNAWQATGLDERETAERFGWPVSVVQTMRAYGRLDVRYALPTPDQLEDLLRTQQAFHVLGRTAFTYELGERFRLLVLEKRQPPSGRAA